MHTHILPRVDDGPSQVEESLRILEKGVGDGIKTFVLTPHIREGFDSNRMDYIKRTYVFLRRECLERRIDVELILGAEFSLTPSLPEKLKDYSTFVINGRYVVIELPFYQLPIYAEQVLFKLITKKFVPIIAHPERYLYLGSNIETIKKWAANGALFQINGGSLSGQYGKNVRRFAKKLLKNGLGHILASDIHSTLNDQYTLSQGVSAAAKIVGKERAMKMVTATPESIIRP